MTSDASTILIHEYGMDEIEAVARLSDQLTQFQNVKVHCTSSDSVVTAHVATLHDNESIEQQLTKAASKVEELWHPFAYGRDSETLSQNVGTVLRTMHKTLIVVESCTGGWLGKTLVDDAGSSDYFLGGWITYSNEMKNHMIGVPDDILRSHGAVSEKTASSMASCALDMSGADYASAVTGIAGPDGGTNEKPVGTVYIGLAQKHCQCWVRHFVFPGDRNTVRDLSVKSALQMLRFELFNVDQVTRLMHEQTQRTRIST